MTLEPVAFDELVPVAEPADAHRVRTAPPAPVVPAIGEVEIGPADVSPVSELGLDPLPQILEATPVDPSPSDEIEALVHEQPLPAGPRLPSVVQPDQRATPSPVFSAVAMQESPAPTLTSRKGKRKRSGGGLKLVMVLVVLGGLVAAGIVFGRPYLFPDDWDGAAAPFVEEVETGLGLEFVEPLTIVAEPTAEFNLRAAQQLHGELVETQPQWRALGLAVGDPSPEQTAALLTGTRSALYSTDDGQIYHDLGVAGPVLDAQLTREMAVASLDQNFGWSVGQQSRTLDNAALTAAEVLRQATAVQLRSSNADALEAPTASLSQLPAVLAYRALAPQMFAQFAPPAAEGADNALHAIGTNGPGPLDADIPALAPGPALLASDTAATTPRAVDRSTWFLTFASMLDSRSAYNASEAIVESALTMADRGTTKCVYATFSGGGVEQTAALRGGLETWAATAPVEFASAFSVLEDGTLQLVTCDPGAAFQAPLRPSAARELIAWRMAELATMEAVGTTDPTDADFVSAWPFTQNSDVAISVADLPPEATPAEVAVATRAGIARIFAPQS
ncbi:MAG: hypothetical protein WBP59_04445 [Ilumatobacteraceae bacterium]